jgi:hypothetical protein
LKEETKGSRRGMLRSIFKSLFPPLEVKATQYEIKSFLSEVADPLCKSIIEGQAISIAKVHGDEVEHEIVVKKKRPDEIALRIINDAIREILLTGEYHLHRGYLNDIGMDILKVWEASMSALCKRGYITDAQAEKATQSLNKQIQWLG